jgi:hypothetical protein
MTKPVSNEQMLEMQEKLANLGIVRPSKKQALKAIRQGARVTARGAGVGNVAEVEVGEDPRVTKAFELINEQGMDPALATFMAWQGDGASMAKLAEHPMDQVFKPTLDSGVCEPQDEGSHKPTGDSDEQQDQGPED